MPSPFPGMDPYLETSGLWPDVHQRIILYASEVLQPQLPARYYALIGERIILEQSPRSYYPDVTVARAGDQPSSVTPGAQSAVAGADVAVEVEVPEEVREVYLEIRDASGGRVVTVIEVLSPANKAPGGQTHQTYLRKQVELLRSTANLVEIDLLRSGAHVLAVPETCLDQVRPFDYLVSVHRSSRPTKFQLYPCTVRQSLPRARIPLLPEDQDVVLDLQAVFERCYDSAPYERLIDYRQEPAVPLPPADAVWADSLLQARGLRDRGS